MSEWRDIWKQTIKASKTAILKRDENKFISFRKLESAYPTDAMVHLEKAIAFEIQKKYGEAKNEYEIAIEQLPVEHWKRVAAFSLKRCIEKKTGRFFYGYDNEEKINENMIENDIYNVQWTAFYDLHNYVFLRDNVRYLSISSMSRIDSETEMAAIVFRSCMEEILKKIYPDVFIDDTNPRHNTDLYTAIKKLFESGKINEKQYSYCDFIRDKGNAAAHEEAYYKDSDIIELAITYDKLMCFLNDLLFENKMFGLE